MDCFTTCSKWFYRGEGNATLVICHPPSRSVLRLRKVPVNPKNGESVDKLKRETTRKELTHSVKFCQDIFVPLLGGKYVHPGTIVELPKDFIIGIKDLVSSANEERPFHRLGKEVTAECELGVVMPDFCFVSGSCRDDSGSTASPTFCVEIKPKCGVLPSCSKHDAQTSLYHKIKQSVCKYCLFQWQKVNNEGKYHRRSEYCPLDLFSMDIRRVFYALKCLFKDPQNNLKIFRDGTLVYSGETNPPPPNSQLVGDASFAHMKNFEAVLDSTFESNSRFVNGNLYGECNGTSPVNKSTMFQLILLQLLIHDSKESTEDSNDTILMPLECAESHYNISNVSNCDGIKSFLDLPEMVFGSGGILNKLLNAQKLDKLGTDEVFKIYQHVNSNASRNKFLQTSKFTPNHTVSDLQDDGAITQKMTVKHFDEEWMQQMNSPTCLQDEDSTSSWFTNMARFMIAASANDCSMMISFQQVDNVPASSTNYFKDAITGHYFKYSIAVVDLDPKNFERIPKYYHEYHKIIENYLYCTGKNGLPV